MARLARLSVAGLPHQLIQRGANGQTIFATEADYRFMTGLLHDAAARHGVALHAWILLPGQFQLIATPDRADTLPRLMQDIGRSYVRRFNQIGLRSGSLWEGRYRSTVLEPEVWLLPAMAALDLLAEQNGLVAHAEDYAWGTCAVYAGRRADAAVAVPPQVWQLGNTPYAREAAYLERLHAPETAAHAPALQRAALRGWVLGSEAFLAQLARHTDRRVHEKRPGRPRKTAG